MSEIIFKSTASEAGFSSLGNWLMCPARAAMDEERKKNEPAHTSPFPEDSKPNPLLTGSLTGELIQRWYAGTPVSVRSTFLWEAEGVVTDLEQTHPRSTAEARRLYEAYTMAHNPDYYGEPLGFEVQVEIPAKVLGIRVTGAIDGRFRLNTAAAERLRKASRIAEAGQVALVDWKTAARATETTDWTLKPTMQLYAMGDHIRSGEKPEHLIWDVVKKTKEVAYEKHYAYALTDGHVTWLKNVFQEIMRRQAAGPVPEPSPSSCVSWGRACSMLEDNFCKLLK